jgi:hypothetical protein
MTRPILTITLCAAGALLLASGVAYACQCLDETSQERYFVVGTITRVDDGSADAGELARWAGTLRLTGSTVGADPDLHLWIRNEISDEQLRNVRIDAEADPSAGDSGYQGGPL